MRLYEVAGNQFQDDLAEILHIFQGRANNPGNGQPATHSTISWPAINNMLSSKGYANINQAMMDKVKDKIDPNGELIKDVNEQGIVLATDMDSPDDETPVAGQPAPKSVDQMAHNAVSQG